MIAVGPHAAMPQLMQVTVTDVGDLADDPQSPHANAG